MKFTNLLSDDAAREELGRRFAAHRVERHLTQAQLAEAAGVSKRTVERLEDGESVQLTNMIRCLRAIDRLDGLDRLLPEAPANPVDLLKRRGAVRSRVRQTKGTSQSSASPRGAPRAPGWVWGDET